MHQRARCQFTEQRSTLVETGASARISLTGVDGKRARLRLSPDWPVASTCCFAQRVRDGPAASRSHVWHGARRLYPAIPAPSCDQSAANSLAAGMSGPTPDTTPRTMPTWRREPAGPSRTRCANSTSKHWPVCDSRSARVPVEPASAKFWPKVPSLRGYCAGSVN